MWLKTLGTRMASTFVFLGDFCAVSADLMLVMHRQLCVLPADRIKPCFKVALNADNRAATGCDLCRCDHPSTNERSFILNCREMKLTVGFDQIIERECPVSAAGIG